MTTKPQAPEPLRSQAKAFETGADLHFVAKYATRARDAAVAIGDGIIRARPATGLHREVSR